MRICSQSCDGCAAIWITTGNGAVEFAKYFLDSHLIADIAIIVHMLTQIGFERRTGPLGAGIITKKPPAHIIINSNNI